MRSRLLALPLLLPLFAPAQIPNRPDLPERLPSATVVAAAVPDTGALRAAWSESRLSDAWRSDDMASLRGKLESWWAVRAADPFQERFGVSPARALEMMEGPAAVALLPNAHGDPSHREVFYLGLRRDRVTEFRRLAEGALANAIPRDARRRSESMFGVEAQTAEFYRASGPAPLRGGASLNLPTERATALQYAFTESGFLFADGWELGRLLEPLHSSGARVRLGSSEGYQDAARRLGALGEVVLYASPSSLRRGESEAAWVEALRLQELGPVLATVDLAPEGEEFRAAFSVPESTGRGLGALLTAGVSTNRVESASLVPADAVAFASFTLEGYPFWLAVEDTLLAGDPNMRRNAQTVLSSVRASYGIGLDTDLIVHLNGEHALYARPVPGEVLDGMTERQRERAPRFSQTALLAHTGGQGFLETVARLMTRLQGDPLHLRLEQVGTAEAPIWTLPGGGMLRPCLAVTTKGLILSSSLEEGRAALRRLNGEQSGPALAGVDDFQAALASSDRSDLRVFSYTSPSAAGEMGEGLKVLLKGAARRAEGFPRVVPQDIPPPEWWQSRFGESLLTVRQSGGSLRLEARLMPGTHP